mgnify:CR=1 FL=1
MIIVYKICRYILILLAFVFLPTVAWIFHRNWETIALLLASESASGWVQAVASMLALVVAIFIGGENERSRRRNAETGLRILEAGLSSIVTKLLNILKTDFPTAILTLAQALPLLEEQLLMARAIDLASLGSEESIAKGISLRIKILKLREACKAYERAFEINPNPPPDLTPLFDLIRQINDHKSI